MDENTHSISNLDTTNDSEDVFGNLVANASCESLSSSQYDWGDNDITQAILDLTSTQLAAAENPDTSSTFASEKSLGKRKATELSTSDILATSSSQDAVRPAKITRLESISLDEESNPFLDDGPSPKPDPYSPISLTPSKFLQRQMDSMRLPYCVQYEIARLVSRQTLKYSDVFFEDLKKLALLKTNEAAAPQALKMLLNRSFDDDDFKWEKFFAKEAAARSPWKELDREEEAFDNDPQCGALGFNAEGQSQGWYGGKVLFHGKLHDNNAGKKGPPNYKLQLEPAALGPSTMFSRRFGSKHIFRLKLVKGVQGRHPEDLMRFLYRPLLLCGYVYRAFYAKESNVFYVRTDEEVNNETEISRTEKKPNIMPFLQFLYWHNPIDVNLAQKMAKYVSRFALGLSNSVPVLYIHQSNIELIDDIHNETDENMTDGAGKINRWSLMQIRRELDLEDRPSAIQVRLFGAKGLLVDDGANSDEFAYAQLTPSQQKIKFKPGEKVDPAHLIVDFIRPSRMKAPCRLSVEVIVNLAENGVPPSAFTSLLETSLAELVEPLLPDQWTGPTAMLELWCNIRRLGGVMAARRGRENAGVARALGYSERDREEEVEAEDEDGFAEFDLVDQAQRSSAWWGDEISGCPSSLEETIMCLLDSGFTPQGSPILREKLHKFIKPRVNDYLRSYRMEVPMSASAFLVPDTQGILEEGEVFFKSSQRKFKLADGTETDVYVGDVLVTRNPCKLPTDIRKMKSVDRPGLHYLTDVIVFSTKGSRRAADWLGGGDYDGDKGLVIYQPEIVEPFKNAKDDLAKPPHNIEKNFQRTNVEVVDFMSKLKGLSEEEQIREHQTFLLGDARSAGIVGLYSTFHEYLTYTLGYTHSETLRMAHMFCMSLDGVKTGKTVDPEVFKKDRLLYDKRPPAWKEYQVKPVNLPNESNQVHPRRTTGMSKFIMDILMGESIKAGDAWIRRIGEAFKAVPKNQRDEDLAAPWVEAETLAARWEEKANNTFMKEELEAIKKHVEDCYNSHRLKMQVKHETPSRVRGTPSTRTGSFSGLAIEVRQDTLRKLSKQFASFPAPGDSFWSDSYITRIRASRAYIHDFETNKRKDDNFTRFPWDVAMRELCSIKAQALGGHKTVSSLFYEQFNIKHPSKHHH